MADSNSDPFDWSVDRVVHEFCRNAQPAWAPNNNPPHLINSASLEEALRENDINGEPLLVVVNQQILKDDLGIKSLGERYYIMRGIECLRNLSQRYHLHQRDQAANFTRSGPIIGGGFMSPQITQSNFSAYPFSPYPILNGELQSRHASPGKHSIPEAPPLFNTPRTRPQVYMQTTPAHIGSAHTNGIMMLQQPIPQFEGPSQQQEGTAPSGVVATLEAGAQGATDDVRQVSGLGLSAVQPLTAGSQAEDRNRLASGEADMMEPSKNTNAARYTIVDGRKRLAPTFVSHLTKAAVPAPLDTGMERGAWYYFGQDGLGPESVFYPDFTSDDDNEEFSHVQHEHSKGRSLYVSRLMKHYYQQPIQQLPDSKARAKIPYSRSLLKPGDPHYFTMFVPGLEPAVHNLSHWPALAVQGRTKRRGRVSSLSLATPTNVDDFEDTEERTHNSDDYDYLLEKYPPKNEDEDVLALYGDSGDEGAYDLETWNEIDQDRREEELENNMGAMSRAEVEAAIDETIKQIAAEWRERKLARTQHKGYRLWMKANHNKQRQSEMNNALYWIHRYDQTIKRMRETITKDVWFKATEVKQQCKIFDEAVAQREEYQYFVTILSAPQAPIRPNVETLKTKDRAPRADVPDGEEILESDSDLGDFILNDDSSDAGSIPHDAAEFADAMEIMASDEPADHPEEIAQETQEVEIPQLPMADVEVAKAVVEQDEKPSTPLAGEPETQDIQDAVESGSISEDDIISPARKAEFSHRGPEPPTTGNKKRVLESLLGSDREVDGDESAQNSDLDALPTLPKSRYRQLGRTVLSPVDLTLSSSPSAATPAADSQRESSSDYQVQTPELNPIPTTPAKKKLQLNPPRASSTPHATPSPARQTLTLKLSLPGLGDIPGIKRLDWELLEERRDYKRILAKVVYHINRGEARKIQVHVQKLADAFSNDQHASVQRHVSEGKFLDQIRNGLLAISNQTDAIEGVSSRQQHVQKVVRQLALLYASYANHTNLMDEERITEPLLQHAFNDLHLMIKSFVDCLLLVLGYFCDATDGRLHGTKRKASEDDDEYKDKIKGDVDIPLLDTDEDRETSMELQEPAAPSSIKKRKRKVLQSQEALSQQRSDQLRVQEEERRKALADMRLANMGISEDDPAGHIVGFGEPQVFLHEHIGKRVKPHQVNGIQFMWREIITDPKQQGCLLAHTMGLGKTMQVISLLVTIALAAKSHNVRIRDQVPEHLRKTKTLILCPPSLIDNWHDELVMWRPDPEVLGKLYKIQSQKLPKRLDDINQWAKDGGVLIISYELFRGSISNDGKKLPEEPHAQVQRDLLDSPTIVVADEAHKMKNAGAKVTQAASRFKTTSRIALTGSPLANNLEEYHTMIDWIAPGYLGTMVQFRAKYSDPISWGLYEDSTSYDKRISLRKLITLGRDLEPKLNRADISAIEKEMPSKTEFFITLPLTNLQVKAYNIYAQALLKGNGTSNPGNTKLWQWLHVLGLLCNHPLPFVNKLDERRYALEQKSEPREKQKMAATDESQGEALPTDVVLSDIGLSPDEIEQALEPFRKLDEEDRLEDPVLSNRSLVVSQIVKESLEVGDKVLIFSHTIPTLNYLEKMLDNIECCNTCRIDGETKMSTRQEATKVFNKRESAFNVFLISMKAGGLGLNLQGANRVIIYDFGFNPTWEDQAIGRAYRLGQKKSVYVYRFRAGGTFEDVTYNKAVFKTTLFSRVVDKKNYMSQAKKSLSSYLFDVKDVEQHSLEDSVGKDRDVLDRIVRRTKCIRNIELTETFQKEDLEKLSEEEVQLAVEEYEDQRMQRDDPAAYARKQATKVADQMQNLSTNTVVRPPAPSIARIQSTSGMLSTPASTLNVVNGQQQATSISFPGSPYFSPQQAAVFGHRAPTASHPPHPFHQELISDATHVLFSENSPRQPPRASSAGPERVSQMDGTWDEPEPRTPSAKSQHKDSLDECRTQ